MGPVGVEPTRRFHPAADFKSAASASSATGPTSDCTCAYGEPSESLAERLGVLLGADGPSVRDFLSLYETWARLSTAQQAALTELVAAVAADRGSGTGSAPGEPPSGTSR